MKNYLRQARDFIRDEIGASAIEYALLPATWHKAQLLVP